MRVPWNATSTLARASRRAVSSRSFTAKLTIEPTLDAVLLSKPRAKGGETISATLQLNCPATGAGRVVVLYSEDTKVAYLNPQSPDEGLKVIVAQGGTSITVPVYTRAVDEAAEVTIRATTLTSSEDAELTVGDAQDHDLAWYATQELPFLLDLL